ncbi:hypothetical protein PLESTB_001428500 [Pleodorina starrii]|uniref:Homogentisate phytyltransferase n=1 Tax=Pleodorina starrii TaxID=330485 RepID=A0A9W6BVI1_9CHLO|nr:hypothetical protein PLESTB_001428500 [Pleodorina starrii]GLC67672.1 hypothetical protein PLESTF_000589300 [Pleodorina starrii]
MVALSRRSTLACRSPEPPCCSGRTLHVTRQCLSIRVTGRRWLGRPLHQFNRTIRSSASVVGEQGDGQPVQAAITSPISSATQFAAALYQFSRPHTMIGTALSVVSISLLALAGAEPGRVAIVALLQALSSALLMNIAIVGINQLYDIEIDKVNKPYLPLASGALSPTQGAAIVAACAAGGAWIGLASGSPALLATLLVSLALGVLYSAELPFMRWKRSPVLAAGCILAVRAIIVQLGFYTHMRTALDGAAAAAAAAPAAPAAAAAATSPISAAAAATGGGALDVLTHLSPSMWFVVVFMLFFSVVIALFKDLPDVAGDSKAGVRTLSVRLGEGAVFRICVAMLTTAYAWAMVASLTLPAALPARAALFCGHGAMAALLLARARGVDTGAKGHLTDYYMFVWKLFYAEYLLIPLFG